MTTQVRNISIVLSSVGIVVTSIWYYQTKHLEPLAALIFAIVALIGLFLQELQKRKIQMDKILIKKQERTLNNVKQDEIL